MNKIYDGPRSPKLHLPPGYGFGNYTIMDINLENITDTLWGQSHPTKLKDTPHYKYTQGDIEPLKDYFNSCKGHTWARKGTPAENMTVEELLAEFDVILNSKSAYLEPPYESHYIMIQNWHSIDGTRRACCLLSNGITNAPVAWKN
jgi:hypothetical protein